MDKNAIKKYAVWARRELIARVSQKALQYGVDENNFGVENAESVNGVLLTQTEKKQRKALILQIKEKGYEQVMEEVAYTWFNRFSALRFMEVNGYLPSHIRVFTDEENNFKPQILTEAIHLDLEGLDMKKVYAMKNDNKTDELYKYLLITQCNDLSSILPGMFQKIEDFSELLFPDNLLREGSVIEQMITIIKEDDWKDEVQIIGWLYQYYNIDPKSVVDSSVKKGIKVSKNELPAKTQIFTPDWVVRYLVENSLGRLWLEGHQNDSLKASWKYYVDESKQESNVQTVLEKNRNEYSQLKPEEILCFDPCMGSGHIIVYLFDVLMKIYTEYGYSVRESVENIIRYNLYGLDIDNRAVQLAYFAVMMKAVQYDKRFIKREEIPQPHLYTIKESNVLDDFGVEYFCHKDPELINNMQKLKENMQDAKEFGSLLNITNINFELLYKRFEEIKNDISIYKEYAISELLYFVNSAELLAKKYDVVVTNPPYLGNGDMNDKLSSYIQDKFYIAKSDMFSAFMLRCREYIKQNRFQAMVTMQSWMNLGVFENLRIQICETEDIITLWHLDDTLLGIAYQTVAFVFRSSRSENYIGKYFMATKEKYLLYEKNMHKALIEEYTSNQDGFLELSGCPIAYSLGKQCIDSYVTSQLLSEVLVTREGMTTGSNDTFLRYWYEVDYRKKGYKWFPYNKGGEYRKWYGNEEYFVNWENDGFQIRNFKDENTGRIRSHNYNGDYAFKEGITWSAFSSRGATFRYSDSSFLFDSKGSKGFCDKNRILYILAFLNSTVGKKYLSYFAGAKDKKPGHIISLPYRFVNSELEIINELAEKCIEISKLDWDSREMSWEFAKHPLVKYGKGQLEIIYDRYSKEKKELFETLLKTEQEINRYFIDIYKVNKEITSKVEYSDVTIGVPNITIDIKALISYAVGCMLGRYSLDNAGLIYAGGNLDEKKYLSFEIDKDNILPIYDDEYDDDIVSRFFEFIRVAFGEDNFEGNLKFISKALGGKGLPKEVIRNYFLNSFFSDHCKAYHSSPIYWLFDAGKKNSFKCLIYQHRYQSDTIARIRTDYIHNQQAKYRTEIESIEEQINKVSSSDKVKSSKKLKKVREQLTEITEYEEKIHHLADQMIEIDLDDGVKVNYTKFQDVLAKIK